MGDLLLLLLLSGLPQMYIFLFYCVIPTAKMTPNNVQAAIKHQHLACRKNKIAGGRNSIRRKKLPGNRMKCLGYLLHFPPLFNLYVIECSVVFNGRDCKQPSCLSVEDG